MQVAAAHGAAILCSAAIQYIADFGVFISNAANAKECQLMQVRPGEKYMSWIDVNGVSIHYRLQGATEKPLVVCFHEIGGSLESFREVAPYLLTHFQVLSFDQRGSGLSEKVRTSFGIDDLVSDVSELVRVVVGDVSSSPTRIPFFSAKSALSLSANALEGSTPRAGLHNVIDITVASNLS